MGKLSRSKRSKPGLSARRRFQLAMLEEEMLEIRDAGEPCILCGEIGHNVGVFVPAGETARSLGRLSTAGVFACIYAFCSACDGPDLPARVERRLLEEHQRSEALLR